jgi:8-oxo-dGTP pyrophosphatase MutT (NUDIX family)
MSIQMKSLFLGSLLVLLGGCGSGGHQTPPAPARPEEVDEAFVFNPVAPHADPLPHDPADAAQSLVSAAGHRDGAGVFVYADHGGSAYVLLARRAPWLSASGTWGVFGGSVETTDLDSAGHLSYARAAEHELYEESVTVYHRTDAIALRACPTHLKQWRSGLRFRTFFLEQPYIPAARFNAGYADAIRQGRHHKFRENDEYRWVRLDDLKDCAAARAQTFSFTDPQGARQDLRLFHGFFRALVDPGYRAEMNNLP